MPSYNYGGIYADSISDFSIKLLETLCPNRIWNHHVDLFCFSATWFNHYYVLGIVGAMNVNKIIVIDFHNTNGESYTLYYDGEGIECTSLYKYNCNETINLLAI